MKKLIITCILLLFPIGHSSADVGGEIVDQVWDSGDSPVRVTGDLTIASLSIEPGVIVEFAGNFKMTVSGILRIVGTREFPVVLKPATDNMEGWQGVYFENTIPGSEFEWCRFEGARSSAVHLVRSFPTFRHCVFVGNRGSYGGGIRAELLDEDLIIENSRFVKNYAGVSGGAIWVEIESGTLVVSDCSFRENEANPDYVKRHASGGAVLVKGNSSFLRCAFLSNQAHAYTIYAASGIYTKGGAIWTQDGQSRIMACNFQSNACRMTAHSQTPDWSYAYGGALFLYSGSMILENSLLAKNTLSAQRRRQYRGSALYVNTGDCSVVNCTLTENTSAPAVFNSNGSLDLINSIVFFNNDSGTQISGPAIVSYSDIQGGFEGESVIEYNPVLDSEYRILPGSPAIDQGHPGLEYQDTFPPGLGTERNDMGFLGGPRAYYWEGLNDLEGACCLTDGYCIHQTENQCIGEGGSFQEIGTDCSFVLCGPVYETPIANAGPDQMVFEQITLDGTLSEDPDGTIASYGWQLTHRDNPAYNFAGQGATLTLFHVEPGFYDVTLTVTDNHGLTDTDEMECAAIGQKGDLNLDGDVDGYDLAEFAEVFGTRF